MLKGGNAVDAILATAIAQTVLEPTSNGIGSDANAGGVAHWAHAGGFVIGMILVIPLFVRRGGPAFWKRTQGHPGHPDADYGRLSPSSIPPVRRDGPAPRNPRRPWP